MLTLILFTILGIGFLSLPILAWTGALERFATGKR